MIIAVFAVFLVVYKGSENIGENTGENTGENIGENTLLFSL